MSETKVVAGASSEQMRASLEERFSINANDIQLKGIQSLPNRVTKEYLEGMVVEKSFTMEPNGRTMICRLTMANGTVYYGFSHTVDPSNFVQETGEKMSYEEALDKAWDAEGYLLKTLRWLAALQANSQQ